MPLFRLTLEKTYYRQGFFNVTVEFDRFIAAGQHRPVAPHGGWAGGRRPARRAPGDFLQVVADQQRRAAFTKVVRLAGLVLPAAPRAFQVCDVRHVQGTEFKV